MSKSIKFFPILLIAFSLILSFYSVIYASNINMNLASENSVSENVTNTVNNSLVDENITDDLVDNVSQAEVTTPSSVTATTEEGLGLSNVLSIILITVGVVLILLAVAIIIRLN